MPAVAFILHARDNVATVLGANAEAGEALALRGINAGAVTPSGPIPDGHKFALDTIAAGQEIIKYGVTVGRATCEILAGTHVHVHNMESLRGRGDLISPRAPGS